MSGRFPVNTAVGVVAATTTAVVLSAPLPGTPSGYRLTGRVIDAPRATGGGFSLAGTVTPGAAPTMTGGAYALTGGPWAAAGTTTSSQAARPAPSPADRNADGAVDERDLVLVLTDGNTVDDGTIEQVLDVVDAWDTRP